MIYFVCMFFNHELLMSFTINIVRYVLFNKRAGVFYQERAARVALDLIKHDLRVY
jgi:hypothetical protein